MAQKVDLFTLLKTFSQKNYSAVIGTEVFIKFMEKNVQRENAQALNIDDWRIDTRGKILRGIADLTARNKIIVEGIGASQKILLNSFYPDMINKFYISADSAGPVPFPDEKCLRIKIPDTQLRIVPVEAGLVKYLNEAHDDPMRIIKLVFPEDYGTGLTLEAQYPQKIMEIAVLKIESCLRNRRQMEFIHQKLLTHFRGQEIRVRNFVNILQTRPVESVKQIEDSSEFIYSVWLYLCPLIKKNTEELIMRSNERAADQVAVIQAAILIMAFNNYYQVLALNKRNTEMALGAVYETMSDPPYMFTLQDIAQFKNNQGTFLNQRYTNADLDMFFKEKMAVGDDEKLPQLLKFKTKDGGEWLVKKENVWMLGIKLLADAQPLIKNEISQRWMKMMRDYQSESAMDRETEFDDLIIRFANFFSPMLLALIHDKKVAVLQDEIMNDSGSLPKDEKFFDVDKPIPLKILLGLRKEDIIHNCKLSLPFWYSIGFVVKLIRLIKHGGKSSKASDESSSEKSNGDAKSNESLHDSAEQLERMLVPEGDTIDTYLASVRDRWNQRLDITAQKKLTEDVHAIVKAHLNQMLKFQKPNTFDNQMLEESAERIVETNYALDKINNKNALKLYIKIYITKLLLAKK